MRVDRIAFEKCVVRVYNETAAIYSAKHGTISCNAICSARKETKFEKVAIYIFLTNYQLITSPTNPSRTGCNIFTRKVMLNFRVDIFFVAVEIILDNRV